MDHGSERISALCAQLNIYNLTMIRYESYINFHTIRPILLVFSNIIGLVAYTGTQTDAY